MERRTLLKGLGAGIGLAAVGTGIGVSAWRRAVARESQRVIGPWPELGEGVQWVLPGLEEAKMVVVDRPHRMEEAVDETLRKAIKRTRTCYVNSSERRLRLPDDGLPNSGETGSGKRILCIGDSVTFGWGVADQESWPARCEAELRRRGHDVHLFNAGVPAQGLPAIRAYLERIAPAMHLDGILLARRPPPGGQNMLQAYEDTLWAAWRANPKAKIGAILTPVPAFDPGGKAAYLTEATELKRRLWRIPFLEATPVLEAAQAGRPGVMLRREGGTDRVVDNVTGATILEAPSVERGLDPRIYQLFEDDPSIREPLFFDSGHPDADGFVVFGNAIADLVEKALWLA